MLNIAELYMFLPKKINLNDMFAFQNRVVEGIL